MDVLTPKQYREQHLTEINVTHLAGGFHYVLIAERKDTHSFVYSIPSDSSSKGLLRITTHYPNGEVDEDVVIYLDQVIGYSIRSFVQKYEVKVDPTVKPTEAAQ